MNSVDFFGPSHLAGRNIIDSPQTIADNGRKLLAGTTIIVPDNGQRYGFFVQLEMVAPISAGTESVVIEKEVSAGVWLPLGVVFLGQSLSFYYMTSHVPVTALRAVLSGGAVSAILIYSEIQSQPI